MKRFQQGLLLLALITLSQSTKAQVQFSGWLASFNTFGLNKHFSIHAEAQLRSTDQLQQVGTILLRTGLNFHPSRWLTLTAGYGLVEGRRNVSGISSLLAEHRIWQQALLTQKIHRVALTHRFRFEERFLPRTKAVNDELKTDGREQAFRFRYFVRSIFPLTTGTSFTQGPYFALQNEVFLNTGDKTAVNGKAFDQNRLYGAIGYRFNGKMDLEAGYLNQYTSTRTSFINNHVAQLTVYKRL
jgi:hypothetical protein